MVKLDSEYLSRMSNAVNISIKGRVQGVGFRPFVYKMANRFRISGTVQNNMDGVLIHAKGTEESIDQFIHALKTEPPRLSKIMDMSWEGADEKADLPEGFSIIPSERKGTSSLVIPIDSAVCDTCIEEMNDPQNPRYHYPFINCTQCGPRYTIIEALPYDRAFTTMAPFELCESCRSDYEDPLNRRHHAEAIACPVCGPKVTIKNSDGDVCAEGDLALDLTKWALKEGKVVAIKGIGGYHLACDARNEEAVAQLRERKKRPHRPLAIMASSMSVVSDYCHVSEEEEACLKSPESPIVLLRKRDPFLLPEVLAPGLNTQGVMLPYTPLHHLLLDDQDLSVLVMTSANPTGLPILYRDEEAVTFLEGIADFVLTHNRRILHPLDDSVIQFINGEFTFLRRSRGYVPDPIETKPFVHEIIAFGGQQKNTFAIGRHGQIFLGPHIGDLENEEVIEHFENEMRHLVTWMGIDAKALAVDLHPNYKGAELAKRTDKRMIQIQHHHAHHVSCMEDNHLTEACYGVILDGTGYGEDGNLWGFELLYGDASSYERLGHLDYTPLPGGEKAIKEPWRNAVGMLIHYFGESGLSLANQLFPEKKMENKLLKQMVLNHMNTPYAGTSGRLFDAISAMLGLAKRSTYDGEAAIRLSEAMPDEGFLSEIYPYRLEKHESSQLLTMNYCGMLAHIAKDILSNQPLPYIVSKFHHTVVESLVELLVRVDQKRPSSNKTVVCSGGSFHNPFLREQLSKRLREQGFKVYQHQKVPCNDGGLALGQIVIAANKLKG